MHFGVLRFRILGDASGPGGFGVFVVVFLADIRVLGDPVFFHRLIFGGGLRGGGLDSGFPPACGAQDTPGTGYFLRGFLFVSQCGSKFFGQCLDPESVVIVTLLHICVGLLHDLT